MVRARDYEPSKRWVEAPTCRATGCTQSTRERKPFCSEHVDEHPYVRQLMDRLNTSEHEIERVRRVGSRAVDIEGINAAEILRELKTFGSRTVERLARDLRMEIRVIEAITKALARNRRVHLGRASRGQMLVSLEPIIQKAG